MKKPIIALTAQPDSKELPGITIPYFSTTAWNCQAIKENGGIAVIVPFLDEKDYEEVLKDVDGVVLTGGADVDPSRYNEETKEYCQATQPDRDAADLAFLKTALKLKKPILCICRGSQIANVHFGGSLYQDIPKDLNSSINHTAYSEFNKEISHSIDIKNPSPLYDILKTDSIMINSLHHQSLKDLGENVIVMATAKDGVVEAWYLNDETQWLRAYQWHPEMQDINPRKQAIYNDFLGECLKNK